MTTKRLPMHEKATTMSYKQQQKSNSRVKSPRTDDMEFSQWKYKVFGYGLLKEIKLQRKIFQSLEKKDFSKQNGSSKCKQYN